MNWPLGLTLVLEMAAVHHAAIAKFFAGRVSQSRRRFRLPLEILHSGLRSFYTILVDRKQILPGLPLSALAAVCPVIAASIVVYHEKQAAGVLDLLNRSLDYSRIRSKGWYAPAILLMPAVMVALTLVKRLEHAPLPPARLDVVSEALNLIAFFIAAMCEELGWTGYATGRLLKRWNALATALLLGFVWVIWHLVPLMQVRRPLEWILWWALETVSLRILFVWLYNNTSGSVFAAASFHTMTNFSEFLIPGYYDPRIAGPLVAFAATVVTAVWGPRTLARLRNP